MRVDQLEGAVRIDVAREGDRRVARMIVAPEERLHFFEADRLEVRDFTDRRPMIGMIGREQRRQQRHRREPVRPVLVVLPAFVQHDVALVRELRLRQRREQVAHPVGFHPQRQLERAGRHHFPVVRSIRVRRSVERGAGALQRLKEPAIVVLRSFEHQVLEEVRESGMAGAFVLRSDVIPDVHGNDRTRVVFVEQDIESVAERVLGERKVHFLKLPQPSISLP
jgi:hypothetical protein